MIQLVYPSGMMMQSYGTNGNCALNTGHSNQRYVALKLTTTDNTELHLALLAYTVKNGVCAALNERTILIITAAEVKAREQRMISLLSADDMGQGIGSVWHLFRLRQGRRQARFQTSTG